MYVVKCTYVHVHVHMYMCMYMHMYICHVCGYMSKFVLMYTYTYTYTYVSVYPLKSIASALSSAAVKLLPRPALLLWKADLTGPTRRTVLSMIHILHDLIYHNPGNCGSIENVRPCRIYIIHTTSSCWGALVGSLQGLIGLLACPCSCCHDWAVL